MPAMPCSPGRRPAPAALEPSAAAGAGGHWFWGVVLRQWPVYAEVALAAALINLFVLATPLFVMNVYDRVVPNNALATLWVLATGVVIVFAFDFLLKLLRAYFVDIAGSVADLKLASAIFAQVMDLQLAARPTSAGAFANDLREFESLRDFFNSASITALVDLPFLLFFIAVIWLLGGPGGAGAGGGGAAGRRGRASAPAASRPGRAQQPSRRGAQARCAGRGNQRPRDDQKRRGREPAQSAWEMQVAASARSAGITRFWSAFATHFTSLTANLVTVGVIVVGVYQIGAGQLTMGALIACSILSGRAMAPLAQVASVLNRYHQARAAYASLNRVMGLPRERSPGRRFLHRPKLIGSLELKQVTFTYPRQNLPALAEVSFKIDAGERVGLIGRIGSGKTTVEKLLLGLYQPDRGAVLVDGTELRQIDPADLRRNIGCVPQDLVLLQGTLRENIALAAPQADDEAVLRAARSAGVDDFVARHPLGYDLVVGERGEALSGGQRQAIAIARALLLDPPILILDEPTSFMDNAAEARLKARLAEQLAGRTLLLITHRASLLSLVDRLIVLDAGRLVADGPREEVRQATGRRPEPRQYLMAARPGRFAPRRCRAAFGGAAAADRLRPHGLSHVLLAAVLLFMVAFLAWARWATLDEVTRGDARVIPSRQIQVVQNLEGGIIAAILVREGEVVDEGQVLMRIDNVRAATDYREKRARYLALLGGRGSPAGRDRRDGARFRARGAGGGAAPGRERAGAVPLAPGAAAERARDPAPAGGAAAARS